MSKQYDVSIRVQMPGQSKENEYHIPVSSDNPKEAFAKAEEEWARAVEIKDYRVKEISK